MVEEKTDDKDITLDQFSSFLSQTFHLFSWTWCNRNTCNTSKFLSLIDASMVIPTIPINTLDGKDTDAQRECWKMNFELHGNVIHQNVRLWKTNLMVPKSTIFDQWLRRKPTTKITLLIIIRQFHFIFFTFFHEPDVIEIRVIPQNFCRWKTHQWRYHPFPSRPLMAKIPRHKENVENWTLSYMAMLYIKMFVFER